MSDAEVREEVVKTIAAEIDRALIELDGYGNEGEVVKALVAVVAKRVADHANDRTSLCEGAQTFGELIYTGIIGFGDKRLGLNS